MKLNHGEEPVETIARLSKALRMMTAKFDQAEQRRAYWKAKAEAHGACSCNLGPGTEGPDECCPEHGRSYHEWVERGDILQTRLAAVKEVIAKVRKTPAANDPFRIALDIADDLEAAVYLDNPEPTQSIEDLRTALMSPSPKPFFPDSPECCASGRCEVCTPGFNWGRDG